MKKKIFIILFLLFVFVYVKPVYAHTESFVCAGSDFCEGTFCDDPNHICYQTLEDALAHAPNSTGVSNDDYIVRVVGEHQITSNHTFEVPVYIVSEDNNSIIIHGNNSTITSTELFGIDSGHNINIDNLNIHYIGEFGNDWSTVAEAALYVSTASGKTVFTNLTISTDSSYGNLDGEVFPFGINIYSKTIQFKNVMIQGFKEATYFFSDDLTLTDCSLEKNEYSIYGETFSGIGDNTITTIKNTKLTKSVLFTETLSIDGGSNLPIYYMDSSYSGGFDNNALYVWADNVSSITEKRTVDIDFTKQKTIDDFLALFRMNTITDHENYTLTTNDSSVAKVEGNKITFLKTGTVTVTALNDDAEEDFTIQFRVTVPNTNPETGRHIVMILLGCMLLCGITIITYRRSRKSN